MPKINTIPDIFISADKVRQAVSMAGFKPFSVRQYSNEYRFNGCGIQPYAYFYTKGKATAEQTPATLVVYPYRLDQLMPVIDSVPGTVLCKAEISSAFINCPPASKRTYIGYSVIFPEQKLVGHFLKALQAALKAGSVTGDVEPTLNDDQVFYESRKAGSM